MCHILDGSNVVAVVAVFSSWCSHACFILSLSLITEAKRKLRSWFSSDSDEPKGMASDRQALYRNVPSIHDDDDQLDMVRIDGFFVLR